MGWQGMASVGHFTTLVGIVFFFFMLFDSHVEKRLATHSTLGIPRWHKRAQYYIFKIRYLQVMAKALSRFPKNSAKKILSKPYFNEFEIYEKTPTNKVI
jgi:hypothetical protein